MHLNAASKHRDDREHHVSDARKNNEGKNDTNRTHEMSGDDERPTGQNKINRNKDTPTR